MRAKGAFARFVAWSKGKRETGATPVRSRHCNEEFPVITSLVKGQAIVPLAGKTTGNVDPKPGNLPFGWCI